MPFKTLSLLPLHFPIDPTLFQGFFHLGSLLYKLASLAVRMANIIDPMNQKDSLTDLRACSDKWRCM